MWFLKMRVDLLKVRTNCGMEQLKMETLSQTALIFIPFLLHWITRRWIVRLRNVRCGRMDLFRFLGSIISYYEIGFDISTSSMHRKLSHLSRSSVGCL